MARSPHQQHGAPPSPMTGGSGGSGNRASLLRQRVGSSRMSQGGGGGNTMNGSVLLPSPPLLAAGQNRADIFHIDRDLPVIDALGNVYQGREKEERCLKYGLCHNCLNVKTHVVGIPGIARRPITNDHVYKGYCLECYDKQTVKQFLGEEVALSASITSISPSENNVSTNNDDGKSPQTPSKPKLRWSRRMRNAAHAVVVAAAGTSSIPPHPPLSSSDENHSADSNTWNGHGDADVAVTVDKTPPAQDSPSPGHHPPAQYGDNTPYEEFDEYDEEDSLPSQIQFRQDSCGQSTTSLSTIGTLDAFASEHRSFSAVELVHNPRRRSSQQQLRPHIQPATPEDECGIYVPSPHEPKPSIIPPRNSTDSTSTPESADTTANSNTDESLVSEVKLRGRSNDWRAVFSAIRENRSRPTVVRQGCKVLRERAVALLREAQDEEEDAPLSDRTPVTRPGRWARRPRQKHQYADSRNATNPEEVDEMNLSRKGRTTLRRSRLRHKFDDNRLKQRSDSGSIMEDPNIAENDDAGAGKSASKEKNTLTTPTMINAAAFLPDNWAKTLTFVLTDYRGGSDAAACGVEEEILWTICVLTALHHRYRTHFTGAEGVLTVLEAMKRRPSSAAIQAYGAATVSCLVSSLLHCKHVLGHATNVVNTLMAALDLFVTKGDGKDDDNDVQSSEVVQIVLRGLYDMLVMAHVGGSTCRMPLSLEELATSMGDYKEKDGGVGCIVHAMKVFSSSTGIEEWSMRLLIALLSPSPDYLPEEEEQDEGEPTFVISSELVLADLLTLLDRELSREDNYEARLESMEDASTLLCLLVTSPTLERLAVGDDGAASSIFDTNARRNSVERKRLTAMSAMLKAMKMKSEVIFWNGCQLLNNLCFRQHSADNRRRAATANRPEDGRAKEAARIGAMEVLVDIMTDVEAPIELVSEACLTVTCLCAAVEDNKDIAAQAEALDALVRVLRRRLSRNFVDDDGCMDRAYDTLATLTTKKELSSAVHSAGILDEVLKEWKERDGAARAVSWSQLCAVHNVVWVLQGRFSLSPEHQKAIAHFSLSCLRYVEQQIAASDDDEVAVRYVATTVSILKCLTESSETRTAAIDAMMDVPELYEKVGLFMVSDRWKTQGKVQVECCGLLRNVFAAHTEAWDEAGTAIEALCLTMELNREDREVQRAVAEAFCQACVTLPPAFIVDLSSRLMNAVGQTAQSMRTHKMSSRDAKEEEAQKAPLQEAACDFLWAMSHLDESLAEVVAQSNIVECIADALGHAKENLRGLALAAAGSIAVVSSVPSNVPKIGTPELIDSVHDACQTHADDVHIIDMCFVILRNLSADTYQVKLEVIRTGGLLETVVSLMYKHALFPSIQFSGCAILAYLAVDNEVKRMVGTSGGVDAVLGAMGQHLDDAGVQEKGCEALCNLMSGIGNDIFVGNGAIERVVNTISHEPYLVNLDVQEKAVSALWNLAVKDAGNKTRIANARGIPAVVNVMRLHLHSQNIQDRCSVALWSLSVEERNKALVGEAHGVEAIVDALRHHLTSAQIQEQCMSALKVLATHPDNKERIVDCGGVDAIVGALRSHDTHANIQLSGFAALTNVSVYHGSDLVSEMNPEVLDVVMDAMRNHGEHGGVQEAVCRLLRNYSFNTNNVQWMKLRSEELVPLLFVAAAQYPKECEQRANDVVEALV